MADISDDAINLIVDEEVSDSAYYTKHYQHWDWPEGASGATIGIGYDCGYCTPDEIRADWADILPAEQIAELVKASGIKGQAAHEFVIRHAGTVTVPFSAAMKEFTDREIPKWAAHVKSMVPNTDKLSPDSFGALVSLAYNRGAGVFVNPGPRYGEGRSIRNHMADENFAAIPDDILSMQRLWPRGSDLWRRRAHEAALFKKGLAT
jgi:GH24 family phage-related lysozyme (muramidase)